MKHTRDNQSPRPHLLAIVCLFAALINTPACTPFRSPADLAATIAEQANLTPMTLHTDNFQIQAYLTCQNPEQKQLTIYLEGDGFAWKDRWTAAKDPTPRTPVSLKLAASDQSANVAYLARPCQYLTAPSCQEKYWTSARYSDEILSAVNQGINIVKERCQSTAIELVGYSGGGVISALLAETRDDIRFITTIAANLDHQAWTTHHQVSPLSGSKNPGETIKSREKLRSVPQLHFIGEKDSVVPEKIVRSYLAKINAGQNAQLEIIRDYEHNSNWEQIWPDLQNKKQQFSYPLSAPALAP